MTLAISGGSRSNRWAIRQWDSAMAWRNRACVSSGLNVVLSRALEQRIPAKAVSWARRPESLSRIDGTIAARRPERSKFISGSIKRCRCRSKAANSSSQVTSGP